MADKPTAVDILNEAMEYLSKLGLKLRSRSDSMKEKKIKQNKLRNSHAVKKTANKVLLLCELSKKSLNIVETTVKNILNAVGSEQSVLSDGDGGNSRNYSSTDGDKKGDYFHFKYKSGKLKITKKVSIKHFTSVTVLAKKMPKTMMKKYPVYYDSKLLRYRKAKEVRNTISREKGSKRPSAECNLSLEGKSNDVQENPDKAKHMSSSKTKCVLKKRVLQTDSEDETTNEISKTPDIKEIQVKSKKKTEKKKIRIPLVESSDSSAEEKNNVKNNSCDESGIQSSKKEDEKETEGETKNQNVSKSLNNKENEDSSKTDHIETTTVESKNTDDDDENQKDIIETAKLIESLNACTNANLNNVTKDLSNTEARLGGEKPNLVSNDDGDESLEKSNEDGLTKPSVKSKDDNEVISLDDDEDDVMSSKSLDLDQDCSKKNEEPDSETKNKPLIKCVNLSKLLKPIVLQKVGLQMVETSRKGNLEKRKSGLKTYNRVNTPKRVRYADEEEFWAPIRKQVATFKPKKLTINISRLPEWSNIFLNQYNIKKVTWRGKVIYESAVLSNEPSKDEVTESIDLDHTNKNTDPDILIVKNALLNDSDISDTNEPHSESLEIIKKPNNKVNSVKLSKTAQDNTKNKSTKHGSKRGSSISSEEDKSKESDEEISQNSNEEKRSKSSCKTKSKNIEESKHSDEEKSKSIDDDKSKHNDEDRSKHSDEDKSKSSDDDKSKNNDEERFKNRDAEKSKRNDDDKSKHSDEERSKNSDEEKSKSSDDDKSKHRGKERSKIKEYRSKHSEKERSKNSDQDKCKHSGQERSKNSDTDKSDASNEEKSKSSDVEQSKQKNKHSGQERSKNSDTDKSDASNEAKSKSSDEEQSKQKNKHSGQERSKNSDTDKSDASNEAKSRSSDEEQSKQRNKKSRYTDKEKSNKVFDEDISNDKETAKSESKEPENKEKTPERTIDNDKDIIDSCLIISSTEKSKNSEDTPTKSKRKHIMESMKAKRMLLTYSSSDTEDEKLNEVLKEIKGSLLREGSSDEDQRKKQSKIYSSSESDVEVTKNAKNTRNSSSSEEFKKKGQRSSKRKLKSREKEKKFKKMGRTTDKAGGSSSQNSDTRDDKDIDGLTNIKALSKSRRRRESSSTDEKATRSSSRKKMSIPPLITGEGLLEAPDSSDNSDPESDTVEELPPISLTGLNGGGEGLTHLAKDDLLGDTDSSSSNENEIDDQEKNDESDDEDVKSKRRKANTISSDSDGGAKSKNNANKVGKVSDFEDSEDGSSEPAKRKRKKKLANDSDASSSGSDEGKKKRRRIKQINDSDASGSDSENEGRNKHGRKNIRKVMGKNQLEEATKKAAREEKERIARIAERQKFYNNLEFDETGKPDEVIPDKLVLDFDLETKDPIIEVDKGLVKKLKPHQANGIRFMWDACFESVKRIKKARGSGCILAHCMGLGKTLQVVALTHTLLTHEELTGVRRVLVVCPLSTVLNWVNEFQMWLKNANKDNEIDVYELSRFKQNSERAYQLSQWLSHGGVCVLGYEMFRNLSADNNKKYKKKMLKTFQEALVDPGPDMVVCDEGHLLKNEKTSLSQSMNKVRTLRRIVLTGTPLQNNLKEYYCMVQFVKPNLLGKYNEYLNRFVNPITNGQYTDSTEHDIKIMKRRSHVLHKMLDGAVQRRDYSVLAPFLPPKHEYVLFITLSEVQIKLYQNYLDNYSRRPLPGKSSGFLFPDFQSLQRIWTHPLVLKYNSERYEIMQQKKREREEEDSEGSLVDFIDDDTTPPESTTEESSDDLSDDSDDSRKKSKKKKSAKKSKGKDKASTRRGTRANPAELEDDEDKDISEVIEVKNENPTEWWIPLVTDDELEDIRYSHKLMLLFDILRQSEAIGDKLLVFSQSLYSLDLIEHFLGKVDEATQEGRIDEKLGGHVGSWAPGVDYFRLDGSTSCENRSIWCKNFNREDNPRARLFLISTRAGGLGINLVAANRVIIFDVSWNPSHDVQSIFRVYRFGQKKPCYIYRFLAMGTMEEKIYERQVTKQAISKRVIDEQQIDRHYAENDLAELYKFEPRPPVPRPLPPVPKDRMFAELLKVHDALIYKFHEHDSLLENKEEETLSEEERKAAWDDFENEKNRPPPSPYPAWPMNNGMVNNLLAQQQQQLAYATLATMLRKEMPNLSDDQLRNMLPIIYGANPSLMQKLSDIYKYPGAGMMNPILNSVMNSGSGLGAGAAAMGGGGSSGLQYEPPWARDQQQQQQIRLQQLMQQQQNSMGAKMYAGGLGSRDPVAMALQQQRAREMMMQQQQQQQQQQAASGRQRGRPPHAPRPPAAADVVTLDSD